MKDEIKRLNDTVEWQRITLLPQSEVKKAITKAKAKMKKEGDETADRLARTALSVMDDYKEAAEEIKQLKEELEEEKEGRDRAFNDWELCKCNNNELREENAKLKEEIEEREDERYWMWKGYCVYQDPDMGWADEEDYQKNKREGRSYHHANSDDEDEDEDE